MEEENEFGDIIELSEDEKLFYLSMIKLRKINNHIIALDEMHGSGELDSYEANVKLVKLLRLVNNIKQEIEKVI